MTRKLSDTASDCATSEYDTMSDNGEAEELQFALAALSKQVGELLAGIDAMEGKLAQLHKPIQSIYADQLGDVPFLETSPFRDATFTVKAPGLPGMDLKKRYKFKDISAALRTYLDTNNLVDGKGAVKLNKTLKTMFGIKGTKTTFMRLVANMRTALV